jgi:hypothetical protein
MPPIPKDLVLAQIHHQETDTIPYTIGFEGDVAERLDVYYGSDAWRNSIDNAIQGVPVPILAVDETVVPYYTDLYGLGLAKALQPETPTENAAAVVEAFLQQAGVSSW